MDVQNCEANSSGEEDKMSTLATLSSFFGTVWFVALVGVAGFAAGLAFKDPFLKLVTGGKYGS